MDLPSLSARGVWISTGGQFLGHSTNQVTLRTGSVDFNNSRHCRRRKQSSVTLRTGSVDFNGQGCPGQLHQAVTLRTGSVDFNLQQVS